MNFDLEWLLCFHFFWAFFCEIFDLSTSIWNLIFLIYFDFSFNFKHASVPKQYRDRTSISFRHDEKFCPVFIEHEAFKFSDYLASIGGLIGLIAGFSLISLVEICYHFLLYLASFRSSRRLFRRTYPEQDFRSIRTTFNQDHVIYQCSQYFFKFIEKSSVHGLTYTTKKGVPLSGRVFWMTFTIISATTCGFLIKDVLKNAELNPITFQIDEEIWKVEDVSFWKYCQFFSYQW